MPALLVFGPADGEVYRYRSRDFADRPTDDDLIDAVRSLDLDPVQVQPVAVPSASDEHEGAFRTDAFGPFFRGIRSATAGLAGRMTLDSDRSEAAAMSAMASSFLDAWKRRRAVGGSERS